MRTDNDIFKIPQQEKYRLAGIQRAVDIYRMIFSPDEEMKLLLLDIGKLTGFDTPTPPHDVTNYSNKIIDKLKQKGIFLSAEDLERDLYHLIPGVVIEYLRIENEEDIIAEMKKRKATFMFDFISNYHQVLAELINTSLAEPIHFCRNLAESNYGT